MKFKFIRKSKTFKIGKTEFTIEIQQDNYNVIQFGIPITFYFELAYQFIITVYLLWWSIEFRIYKEKRREQSE